MDEIAITQYLTETYPDIRVESAEGNSFFFFDPDRKIPFATLVTSDAYDDASDLNRPGVYRLNIDVSRATYLHLFGAANAADDGFDFTALDRLMPHPVYASMFWVCVLNPTETTFHDVVRPLLAEAHDLEVRRHAKREPFVGE